LVDSIEGDGFGREWMRRDREERVGGRKRGKGRRIQIVKKK
jgi:hypothetical protein